MNNNIKYYKIENEGIFFSINKNNEGEDTKMFWCTLEIAKNIIESISDLRDIPHSGNEKTKIANFDPHKITKINKISKEHLRRTVKSIYEQEEEKLKQIAGLLDKKFEDIDDIHVFPKYGKKYSSTKSAMLNQVMLDELINALKKPDKRSWAEDNSDLIFNKIWSQKKYEDVIFESKKENNEYFLSFTEDNKRTIKRMIHVMEDVYHLKFNIYYFVISSFKTQNTLMEYLINEFEELFESSILTEHINTEKYKQLKYMAQVFPTSKVINAQKYYRDLHKMLIPDYSYQNLGNIIDNIPLPNDDNLLMISRGDDREQLIILIRQHFEDRKKLFNTINFLEEVERKIYQEIELSEYLFSKLHSYLNN